MSAQVAQASGAADGVADGTLQQVPTPIASARPLAVEVRELDKAYTLRPVLRHVSFAVEAGQQVALLGPNGTGKTTLLRVLATLAKPSGGSARVAGLDVVRQASEVRPRVGYVGHAPLLYDELTIRENLLFYAQMYGLPERESRVDALIERVGMTYRAHDRAGNLSRGQAQRIALARGLLHEPSVLLLDEPDTGLDEDGVTLLTQIIEDRARAGQTTLLTTHQLERGLRLSDAALVLVGGRIVRACPSAELDAAQVAEAYAQARRKRGQR